MVETLLFILIFLVIISIVLLVILINRNQNNKLQQIENQLSVLEKNYEKTERALKEEITLNRHEMTSHSGQLRQEVLNNMTSIANLQKDQLDIFSKQLYALTDSNENKLTKMIQQNTLNAKEGREELNKSLKSFEDRFSLNIREFNELQAQKFDSLTNRQKELIQTTDLKLDKIREMIESKLKEIQQDNNEKLEKMRVTVDEKLHETLDKRLGESFKLVSERLDMVHKGLGEMQILASSVGDLKKILSNIKARGIWGEMQLEALLEQILTNDQYAKNIATKKNSNEKVEFAVRLPGRNEKDVDVVWLPIDAKFPKEDYEKLVSAHEHGEQSVVDELVKKLESQIKSSAKDIRDKYLDPPNTTDFAIMFLPIEGLYAEVLRIPGLSDTLQREYRVNIAGPTTMAALLNSLQMGFRTLAIEKRSSEVWALLGAVKTEFNKFGTILEKTHKKLQEASGTIEDAAKASRKIEKRLKDVQELPQSDANAFME